MGEAWDDLAVSRAQRAQGADDVAQITTLCARDHPQHKHVLECRECYGKVIDRMSRRYLGSKDRTSQPEWFSGRDALLKDLEELFVATREYKADLNEVDVRLDEERRRWYGQRAKASPSIRKSLEDFLNERDVFAAIGLDGVTFEDNVGEVREALGRSNVLNGEATADGAERAVERLIGAKLPEERVQVYKEMFFQGKPDEEMSGRTQMYLESFRSGATMDEIITKIVVDRRSSIGALEQKERHRQRVEELRRARAAHELQKSKKASGRKDSNHSNQRPQPPDEMYDQPPCHACGGELDLRDYLACPLCQVLVDNGVRTKAIVFCSAACFSGHHGQVSFSGLAIPPYKNLSTHTKAGSTCGSSPRLHQPRQLRAADRRGC